MLFYGRTMVKIKMIVIGGRITIVMSEGGESDE